MQITLKFLLSLSISFWIGTIFFFSFFAAPSIFKILPRETAGNVVSDIFPKYYLVAYVCGLVAVISSISLLFIGNHKITGIYGIRTLGLLIMLGLALYAGQVVRPEAVEVRSEMRIAGENSSNYPELRKNFSTLHMRSAILNSVIFIIGIALVFINTYTYRN
jgi:putative copper export protein